MRRSDYLILFILALAVLVGAAAFVRVPGYMDAEYYFAGGMQLASGKGFSEPFIWNYLDDPPGIPHPSHTYWMPLTSILASAGMLISGKTDFASSRLIFILLAALIPAASAYISWRLSQRRLAAWIAGLLAIFPGFYCIYMGITDTFPVYMVLGSLFLIIAASSFPGTGWKYFSLGILAGFMHMARADGILWFASGALLIVFDADSGSKFSKKALLRSGLLFAAIFIGYLLVIGWWYGRNLVLYSSLFSPAGGRAMWLTDYDQLFGFPGSQFNLQSWLNAGLGSAILTRWEALKANLGTAIGVQAEIVLLPFILAGIWRMRRQRIVQLGILIYAATFCVMTLIFPLAGSRGGFFHSGAAFQPLFWALAADGFIGSVELGVRLRNNWKFERASKGFGFLLVFVCAILTLVLFMQQVSENGSNPSAWEQSSAAYRQAEKELLNLGAGKDLIVAVNNPPGYYVATGREAIVIPDGGLSTLLDVSEKYGASYLLLEQNSVAGLRDLYKNPQSLPGLEYINTVDQIRIFRISQP